MLFEHSIPLPMPAQQKPKRYVLLYGLTDAAETFIRSTRRDINRETVVAGILDDEPTHRRRIVQGVKVVGSFADIRHILAKFRRNGITISEIIVADFGPSRQQLGDIVEFGDARRA